MKNKFSMFIRIGMLLVIIDAALVPEEEKYLRAAIAVIGAGLAIYGLVIKNRMKAN